MLEALRLEKPAVVIVRRPRDAIASEVARFDGVDPARELLRYERFRRRLLPHAGRVVVATLERVTSSCDEVIGELNRRFGTAFVPFPAGDEIEVQKVFDALVEYNRSIGLGAGRAAAPERDRERRTRLVADRLRCGRAARRLRRGEALYAKFASIERSTVDPAR